MPKNPDLPPGFPPKDPLVAEVESIVSMDVAPQFGAVLRLRIRDGEELHLEIPTALVHSLSRLSAHAASRLPGGTKPEGELPH